MTYGRRVLRDTAEDILFSSVTVPFSVGTSSYMLGGSLHEVFDISLKSTLAVGAVVAVTSYIYHKYRKN